MKKLALLVSVLVFLCSCNSEKDYKKQASETIDAMNALITVCDAESELYISVWHGVIFDNWYDGEYCNNFSLALDKEMKKNAEKGLTSKKQKKFLDEKFNQIKDVPKSCKESYDELIELYADASEYSKLADNPDGSLKSYTEKMRGLKDTLKKGIDLFKLKYLKK